MRPPAVVPRTTRKKTQGFSCHGKDIEFSPMTRDFRTLDPYSPPRARGSVIKFASSRFTGAQGPPPVIQVRPLKRECEISDLRVPVVRS